VFKISQDLEKNRISEIKKFRSQQDIKKALIGLEKATRLDQNTMPLTISAVESGCTLGEISDIFRKVFGTHL
jgi:methylmalonyl-CoA mutase N-terminal domain/subunit